LINLCGCIFQGEGRIVVGTYSNNPVLDKEGNTRTPCSWEPLKTIKVPEKAEFQDYSDLAFLPSGQLSIISQEDSSLFIADFDHEILDFTSSGKIYNFPRNDRCEVQYCNVEGIVWFDQFRFVAVSDKAKDEEPFFCLDGDQTVAIFALPP
jgi:hypothetical protein